jgi:RNA polymerase sigma-70 factor (ECF subfamily)
LTDTAASTDRPDITAEAAAAVAAIQDLPEAYRETLALRLVEGLSGSEIAAATGLTPDSVRVNLHRGFKLLRERLGATT